MRRIIVFLVLVSFLTSCKKESSETNINGKFRMMFSKALVLPDDSSALSLIGVVSITNNSGIPLYTNKIMTFKRVSGYYKTDSMDINTGSYVVTKFIIYNNNWECIGAAPIAGSLMATAGTPLPFGFIIPSAADTSIKTGEVGFVRDIKPTIAQVKIKASSGYDVRLPADFGYGSFHYNATSYVALKLATYEKQIGNVNFYTNAKLEIIADSFLLVKTLKDSINTIGLPVLTNANLKFRFTKAGYDTIVFKEYPKDTLTKYTINPLLIYINKKP